MLPRTCLRKTGQSDTTHERADRGRASLLLSSILSQQHLLDAASQPTYSEADPEYRTESEYRVGGLVCLTAPAQLGVWKSLSAG